MTNEDVLRRAVELAPDVAPWDFYKANPREVRNMSTVEKDALAAALADLVDKTEGYFLGVHQDITIIESATGQPLHGVRGQSRTANTINCIVEFDKQNPGVLPG